MIKENVKAVGRPFAEKDDQLKNIVTFHLGLVLTSSAGAQDPEDKSTTCEAAGAHVANVNADDQKTRGAAIIPPDTCAVDTCEVVDATTPRPLSSSASPDASDAASANTDNALASVEPVGHIAVREGAGEASVTAQDQPIATQKPIGSIDNPCDMDGSSKVGYAPAAATDAVATQRAGEETIHHRESSSPQPAQSCNDRAAHEDSKSPSDNSAELSGPADADDVKAAQDKTVADAQTTQISAGAVVDSSSSVVPSTPAADAPPTAADGEHHEGPESAVEKQADTAEEEEPLLLVGTVPRTAGPVWVTWHGVYDGHNVTRQTLVRAPKVVGDGRVEPLYTIVTVAGRDSATGRRVGRIVVNEDALRHERNRMESFPIPPPPPGYTDGPILSSAATLARAAAAPAPATPAVPRAAPATSEGSLQRTHRGSGNKDSASTAAAAAGATEQPLGPGQSSQGVQCVLCTTGVSHKMAPEDVKRSIAAHVLWKLATTKYAAAASPKSSRPQKRTAGAADLHTPAEKRTRGTPAVMCKRENHDEYRGRMTDDEDDVGDSHALGRGGDEYHGHMTDEEDVGVEHALGGDEYHGCMTDDEDDVPACVRGNQRGHEDCACDYSAESDEYEGAASDEGDESMADDDGGSEEDSEPEEEEGSAELSEDERVSRREEKPPQWALEGRALATTWEPRESDLLCDDGASDFEQAVQGCASDIHADNVMGSETFEARVCECGDWEGCTCTDGLYAPLGGRHKQTGRWFMHTLVRCPDVFYMPRGSHSHGGGGDGEDGGLRELLMCVGRLVHSEGAVWGQQQQQGAGQAAAAEAVAGEVEGHERAVREAMLGERAMQMPAEAGLDELHWFVGMLLWDRGVHLFDREHGPCSDATLALVWVGRYLCMARWTLRTNCLLI
eukprot:m51a1_g9550 hypothetical protein (900) ;mRNA; f:872845-876313